MINKELFYFDGKENIQSQSIFKNIKDNFTYEFWVKPEVEINLIEQSIMGKSGLINQHYVIFPGHPGVTLQSGLGISVGTNGINVLEHTHSYLPATLVYKTNIIDWTHIAVVLKNKIPLLYINGHFIKRGLKSPKEDVFASGSIGGFEPYGFFVGAIKNLRIWDHERNIELIKQCLNKELTGAEEGLFLNWSGYGKKTVMVRDKVPNQISNHKNDHQYSKVNENKKASSFENRRVKLIAFYLPQFHEVPENNQWWGKGFTEWVNAKKAAPLFPGHYQPREPDQDFYYDLTDPLVRKWQVDLAKKYGIYGFCYYHYWFKGKTLLEKPFHEVLRTGEPDFPFCLSWANEPWTRRWDGRNDLVLMPQSYGKKPDWKEHFYYLLKAFKDDRYIRVEEKPLFLIYRPASIPDCSEMLSYWDVLARQNGLKGIYFAETFNGFRPLSNIERFDAAVEFEPHYTIAHGNCNNIFREIDGYKKKLNVFDYDAVWSCILSRNGSVGDKKIIPGAFVDWDNTARRGTEATIYHGATPEKFGKYLSEQIKRAKTLYESEFLFINAWNEWAEGTYLEPDKKYQYQYLEAVAKALKKNDFII